MTMSCRGAEPEALLGLHPPPTTDCYSKSKCLTKFCRTAPVPSMPDFLIKPRNGSEWSIPMPEYPFFFLHGALGNPKACTSHPTSPVSSARADCPGWLWGIGACAEQAEETKTLDLSQKGGSAVHSLACVCKIINHTGCE